MKKYRVTFLPAHKSIEVSEGSTIAQAAQRAETHVNNLGWHSFEISLSCLQHLSDTLRDYDWKVTVTVVKDRGRYRIQKIEPLDTSNRNFGLAPDVGTTTVVGNSSLTGARMALTSEEAFEKCLHVSRSMTNIELSNYPPYMDEYIAALFLPHTDRRLFSSVFTSPASNDKRYPIPKLHTI